MKKTGVVISLIAVLISSLFVFSGCKKSDNTVDRYKGRPTKQITYTAPSIYTLKVNVPFEKNDAGEEVTVYNFRDEMPESVSEIFWGGANYLVGDKVVASFSTSSYTYQTGVAYKEAHGDVTPSFEGFKEFIFDENSTSTYKKAEVTKLGDREALKNEYRYGAGSGVMYGYQYIINIDDIYPRGYFEIAIVTADGKPESVETVFSDDEVNAIINSIVVEGQK